MSLRAKKEEKAKTGATGVVSIPSDGLVHATVFQMSFTKMGEAWNRGNALDDHLVQMQNAGAEIISVMPYIVGNGSVVRVIITYRAGR